MDTVLRASSFENSQKKILIPFETEMILKKIKKKKYIIYSFLGDTSDIIQLSAKNNLCTHIYENNKIKKI